MVKVPPDLKLLKYKFGLLDKSPANKNSVFFCNKNYCLTLHFQNMCSIHPFHSGGQRLGCKPVTFKVNMIVTIPVIVLSIQSNLILNPFKTDFLNVPENFALLREKKYFFKTVILRKTKIIKGYIHSIFNLNPNKIS